VHLTLADESVFATAVAIQVDCSARRVTWCSAGHPPAFVCRASSGDTETMDSTAMLLGPVAGEAYEAEECSLPLNDGDTIVAYTDGAIECRDGQDRQLGIEGLRELVLRSSRRPLPDLLDAVMSGIAAHRHGAPDDDTLLLALTLRISAPAEVTPAPTPPVTAAAR
jgi:sigma-B regulation protein RsbU (phosphoserine phosphatase)